MLNFMIAGRDTTSNCISWSVYMLLTNPGAKAKFIKEIETEIGMDNPDFTFDDISKLKYTVTKKEGNAATVNVSGTINCDGQIFLVKEGGKWRISKKEALDVSPKKEPSDSVEIKETSPVAPKKIASHGEQKPESSHGEQEISHKQ